MPTESVLSLYWELASTNEKARLKAAADLIKSLREAQQKHRETLRKVFKNVPWQMGQRPARLSSPFILKVSYHLNAA